MEQILYSVIIANDSLCPYSLFHSGNTLCYVYCYIMLAKEFVEDLFCQNKLHLSGEQFFRVIIFF